MSFRFNDDKTRIYNGREKLRKRDIRVKDELTKRQRDLLQRKATLVNWK